MNRQDIYDKVRTHLLSMPGPSVKPSDESSLSMCLYLSPEGRKCAVGILIPDGHPAQDFVGDVMDLLNNHPDLGTLWGIDEWDNDGGWEPSEYDDVTFLYQLQQVHDGGSEGLSVDHHWGSEGLNEAGRDALDEVALSWGLTIEPGGWDA